MNFKSLIRTVPNFPKQGIMFRDITPLLASGTGFRHVISVLSDRYAGKVDKVVGIEARGFIFGAAIAHQIGAGFVPVRKPGKLPAESHGHDYELEYGTNRVELHVDGLAKGERVVVVDDLLATGGTALAALALVEKCHAQVVECAFLIELTDLPGRSRLEKRGLKVHALCGFSEDES
ncbi:MAG TPA: adenine phosphoribosyltransferase [Xanthomonadales bacterium]|nr:adenine phosphoribosyltransferase [Xanthomonadales bacterium]